jgi:thiamine-phosphate pyrophosphorylase
MLTIKNLAPPANTADHQAGLCFAPCPQALGLYAVLPTADWVGRMALAGVPTVQLRFKSTDPQAIAQEVRAAVQAVQSTGSRLFINDYWRLAIEAGAYGAHLGQEDLDTLTEQDLATLRQSGLRLGISTHTDTELVRATALRPSYIALGAVFPTTLKAMPTAPLGLERLAGYAKLLQGYSTVAIGGIGAEHLRDIAATGVGSFAVVRAVVAAPNPEAAAHDLMAQWSAAKK